MPRRYSDYPDSISTWSIIRSCGSLISIAGVMLFFGMIWQSLYLQNAISARFSSTAEFPSRAHVPWHSFNETTVIG